jgi:hypothetical protein
MRKLLRATFCHLIIVGCLLMLAHLPAYAASMSDEAVLGNNRWSVNSSGSFVPNANTYSIGSASQYPASIWLNGNEYTSFAAGTDGNWTDTGLTLTANGAPTKFILTYSTGAIYAVGFTVGTGEITFENGQVISGTTNNAVTFGDNSDTATMTFSGNDVVMDTSDGGYIFTLTDATDGTVDFMCRNDSDDYLQISTVSNVPTILTAGTSNLGLTPDGGTVVVTGILTVSGATTSTGILTATAGLTLSNGETLTNATNGTVTVTGNAAGQILDVLDAGTSNTDATLSLSADAAADNGDVWRLTSDGGTNSLFFENNATGSQATYLTLSNVGLVTLTAGLVFSDAETLTNVSDVLILTADDNDACLNILGYEAKEARIRLNADQDDDATDGWEIASSVAGTLTIGNDSSAAGTYVDKLTISSAGVITLVDGETITNASDVVTIGADDAAASLVVSGFEGSASAITIQSDEGDDAADKFIISMSAADSLTMTTGVTLAQTISTAGLTTLTAATVTGTLTANGAIVAGYEMVTTTGDDPGTGAASLVKLFTDITSITTGSLADVVTLAAGAAGQMKVIQLAVDGETTGTSISANFFGVTAAALMEDVGDCLILISDGTEWHIILNTGCTLS